MLWPLTLLTMLQLLTTQIQYEHYLQATATNNTISALLKTLHMNGFARRPVLTQRKRQLGNGLLTIS